VLKKNAKNRRVDGTVPGTAAMSTARSAAGSWLKRGIDVKRYHNRSDPAQPAASRCKSIHLVNDYHSAGERISSARTECQNSNNTVPPWWRVI
jgi:hypothetical protein